MLTIDSWKTKNGGQLITDYHSKDALGVWALGSGLPALGLSALGLSAGGGFDPEATSRLAEGFHAATGAPLARNAGADHRRGWDITIDDPKDFSLIHAFGSDPEKRDYYDARREAWRVVGAEIQRLVRPKYAGHVGPVKIAMQVFEHDDSRSGDPHKHGHGFLFNVGVLPDGKACAIDAGPVMRAKAYLGQLYQSELARQFALRSHAVAFDERESTDAKTKTRYAVATIPGLATPEQLAGFSERSADIAKALDATGDNKSARAKNAAALATRDEKKLTHAQMRTLWNEKARALGLDMDRFHAALGAGAIAAEKADIVKARVVAEVEALSLQAIEGNGTSASTRSPSPLPGRCGAIARPASAPPPRRSKSDSFRSGRTGGLGASSRPAPASRSKLGWWPTSRPWPPRRRGTPSNRRRSTGRAPHGRPRPATG